MRHWERLATLFKHDVDELDPKAFIREFRLLVWEGVGVGRGRRRGSTQRGVTGAGCRSPTKQASHSCMLSVLTSPHPPPTKLKIKNFSLFSKGPWIGARHRRQSVPFSLKPCIIYPTPLNPLITPDTLPNETLRVIFSYLSCRYITVLNSRC